ncbi:Protein DegV [Lentibacillus sp. JNUCC-1]|uniref:DegV family protein n=1 Tax=Lentibacillus sp. JNUCC-1 TaxID=2654513 RepID=UPI0012E98C7F|nr:DegV family protein [Lentibacillus sp. JNUCC-1]MUV39050.1 Protein DegV [Lentibacillus sp. JNUCC-1]
MKVAVVTDSTAYLPEEILDRHGIHIVPLSVVFGSDAYREGIDITTEDFYKKVKEAENLPKTSQPSIGEIENKYRELAETYDAVISIHLSSGISGTYQAAVTAGHAVEGIEVYPFDSEISCMAQGFYCIEAARLASDGAEPETITARLDEMKQHMRAYFMVDDLTHLQRGGRLSNAQAFVGSLLQVKPVLHFENKVIVPFEKIRTRKKAIRRIVNMLKEDLSSGETYHIVFIHANNESAAIQLKEEIAEEYPKTENMISYFGPVIGTHLGEGALGICWYKQ